MVTYASPPVMRAVLLTVVVLLALVVPVSAVSADAQSAEPQIAAASWYLVGEDGSVLAGGEPGSPRAVASITKLMTAVVALEQARLTDVVRVSPSAASIGESTVYLRAGEELSVADLIRATLIPSANDAAQALALHVGRGSADRFVGLMNAKAEELGLSDTNFENPHGLDESGHVSSARDATVLVRYALGVPFIRDALSRSTVSLPGGRTFPTTDDLLVTWAPLVGGKTGHTLDAGWSQAAAAERSGVTVYGTVLGSDARGTRNDALRELLEYGLDQYRRVQVIDAGRAYVTAETGYGQPDVDLVAAALDRPHAAHRQASGRACRRADDARAPGREEPGRRPCRGLRREPSRRLVEPRRGRERRRRRFPCQSPVVRDTDGGERLGDRVVIVTVTTNAALDRTLTVPVFQIGFRHRSSDVLTLAGGKGINVARALKILDVPVVATGLAGGRTGTRIIEELTAEAILNDFVRIAAESRTSTAVVDPTAGTHTEINEWGPEVGAAELEMLVDKLHYLSRGADFVVLSGSLPRKVETTFYADAVRDLSRRDVRVVLDSEGVPLRLAVEAGPYLVSPNQREAEQLVGQELEDDDDFLMALDAIAEMGARNVLITLENGCFALLRVGRKTRRIRAFAPHVEPVSGVGSGDVLLAQFLAAIGDERTPEDSIRAAVAAGAASVREVGAGRFDPAFAATIAADIELAELQPVRS